MFDLCGSTLLFIALTMISASVYQMLKGSLVFIAAVYSMLILKRRFFRHHWIALIIVITGVVLVGKGLVRFTIVLSFKITEFCNQNYE